MKQLQFWKQPAKDHGGSKAKGCRKGARPIATRQPMLISFRSSRALGAWNFLRFERKIDDKIRSIAHRFRVKIYRCQNVGNHIHLVTRARSRRELQNFLRVVPQAIVFLVTGARKGKAIGRFWDDLVHSRVVTWGRQWRSVNQYISRNHLEAAGAPRDRVDELFAEIRATMRERPG